jgi:hypothetical protein
MGLIGLWDQIEPDYPIPNYSFIPNVHMKLFPFLLSISNGISLGLAKIDLIKQHLLYLVGRFAPPLMEKVRFKVSVGLR